MGHIPGKKRIMSITHYVDYNVQKTQNLIKSSACVLFCSSLFCLVCLGIPTGEREMI